MVAFSHACRLYLVTPPNLHDVPRFAEQLESALGAGDVAALQLRMKTADDATVLRAIEQLMPVAQQHDVAFILNDRPDLANQGGCDGVHVGQDDSKCAEARRIMGSDRIVGVTCHDSRHLAMLAAEDGADYIAFGAFYPTQTKEPPAMADASLLRWWQETMTPPCVAIGGITPDNARPLVEAGADFLAVCSGVWDWPEGPADAIRKLNQAMTP